MTTEEQRMQMIELSNQGLTAPKVASKLNCSVWTVRKWKQLFKKKRVWYLKWGAHKKVVYQAFPQLSPIRYFACEQLIQAGEQKLSGRN